jgi:hypothetical protein
MSRYDDRRRLHAVEQPRPTMRVITDEESRQIAEDPTIRRIHTFTGVLGDVLIAAHRIGCTPSLIEVRPYVPEDIHPSHHVAVKLSLTTNDAYSTLATAEDVQELGHHLGTRSVYALESDNGIATHYVCLPDATIAVIAESAPAGGTDAR